MSKASKLGAGSSFGQAQGISARRAAINASTAAPTEGAPPPVTLPVGVISLNPDNPRSELGDLTDLSASLRDHGQKTAISIMGRFAYVEANPGREGDLETGTRYVAIDGNSRLAAAREAGLAEIKVMLDDELGSNPDEILESALVANIHRQDLDHLDEAKALKQLLKVHGTQEALAARLHRSQGWVSQRLALLTLTPDLKQKLQSGQESAALLRQVGKKKADEQEAHLRRLKEKQAQEAAEKKARAVQKRARGDKQTPASQGQGGAGEQKSSPEATPGYYGVIKGADESGPSEKTTENAEESDEIPPQRSESGLVRLPSQDPEMLSGLIIAELDVPTRRRLTELLVDYKIEETKRMRAAEAMASEQK
ncbi:ParB/RepB/Spo0J family partition protein (plasmid) [Streptomyces sp. NBC_00846]|uniref:ParB/RepB/Spo0J family partition protein n=1 Tax=Streptomyces sp. NBC_00846 TaxID=2975849 RepID=UPI002F90F1F7|nr:ParB/RepB/Spo0J family partition protein [Streptomyces sp. NBC_00846]